MQHFSFFVCFFLSVFIFFFFVHHPLYSSSRTPRLSSCLSVSKASRRTHPDGPRRSWQWGSCCGFRQPRHPRSGCLGPGSSGCWSLLCPWPPSRTAGGWGSARPRCFLAPPWRTGRIQSLCHNTGRSWTGSSGFGCLSMGAAGRCGI